MSPRKLPGARPNRRPPAGAAASSGTSAGARGALLLGVAVILGIVLLQKFDTSTTVVSGPSPATTIAKGGTTTTTRRVGLTTVPVVTPTTVKARAHGDVKVVVANGSGVRGLAAATTDALKALGYATLTPADVTGGNLDKTTIQFVEGYEAEAREMATALSQPPTVVTKLASPPVAVAALGDAHVVVILGIDVSTTTTSVGGGTTTTTRRLGT